MTIGVVNELECRFLLVMFMDTGYRFGDVDEMVYFSDVQCGSCFSSRFQSPAKSASG